MHSSTRRYAIQAATTGVLNGAVSAGTAVVCLPLLVSQLGIQRYGDWAALSIFVGVAAALDLGLTRSIVMHCAGKPAAISRAAISAAAILATAIAVIAITCMLTINTLGAHVSRGSAQALNGTTLIAGCLVLVLGTYTALLRAVLESQFAVHLVNVGYLLQTVLLYGLSLLAIYLFDNQITVLFAPPLAFAVVLAVHAEQVRRAGLIRWARPARHIVRSVLRTGWQSYAVAAPTACLPPLLSLAYLQGSPVHGGYGVFDIAYRIASLSATMLASVAVPLLAIAAASRHDSVASAQAYRTTRSYLLATAVLFTAGLLTFLWLGPIGLRWLFPSVTAELFPLATWLLLGSTAIAAAEPATRMLLGHNHQRAVFFARTAMLTVVAAGALLSQFTTEHAELAKAYAFAGVVAAAVTLIAFFRSWPKPAPLG